MLKVTGVTGEGHVLRITYEELGHTYEVDHYNPKYDDFDYEEANPVIEFIQDGTNIVLPKYNINIDIQDIINEKVRNKGAAMNIVAREIFTQETTIENFVFALSRKMEEINPEFEKRQLWDLMQKYYYDQLDNTRELWNVHYSHEPDSLHIGDCTKFACSCTKCEFEDYIRKAQRVFLKEL